MAQGLFDDPATVRRGFSTVTRIMLLALLCAAILISIVNDACALLKEEGEIRLTLDEPCTLTEFSALLEAHGILRNPFAFSLYVRAKDRAALIEGFSGELVLNRGMSYREILSCLSKKSTSSVE